MVQYTCFRCGYSAEKKNHMIAHLNRKYICKPILRDIKPDDYRNDILEQKEFVETVKNDESAPINSISCEYCAKTYKYERNLLKHLKTCKIKKETDKNNIISDDYKINNILDENVGVIIEAHKYPGDIDDEDDCVLFVIKKDLNVMFEDFLCYIKETQKLHDCSIADYMIEIIKNTHPQNNNIDNDEINNQIMKHITNSFAHYVRFLSKLKTVNRKDHTLEEFMKVEEVKIGMKKLNSKIFGI